MTHEVRKTKTNTDITKEIKIKYENGKFFMWKPRKYTVLRKKPWKSRKNSRRVIQL